MAELRTDIPDTARLVRLVQALMANSFDIIKVVDQDLKTVFVSSSVERILGYSPHELIGTNPLDYVHPDDLAMVTEELARIQQTGEMVRQTVRARHHDGTWRYVD
ncbi:MAG TPA: PAS domain-containing protein, partial [Candidatus Krumholzibacteria bacterium]|nr:PAS domain-containing protein [Candidatus Krumholzibacteria bacterium]